MTYRNVASLDPGVLPEHRQSTLLFLRLNVTHQWMQFLSWKFGDSLLANTAGKKHWFAITDLYDSATIGVSPELAHLNNAH